MTTIPTFVHETSAAEAAEALAPNIKNKTVLVTGVTKGGLGFETARVIAHHEPKLLILAGRSDEKNAETEQLIKKEVPDVNIRLLNLDLGSFATTRAAINEVNSWDKSEAIDVLINNAAVMGNYTPKGTIIKTPDGIENKFAINHLAPFLFTNLIMPRILAGGPGARIVNVSSRGHHRSNIRWDDVNFDKGFDGLESYGQSKTANILFAKSLAKKLAPKGITAFSLHPGSIWTNLARDSDIQGFVKLGFLDENLQPKNSDEMTWKTLSQGASTTIVAAFDPRIEKESGGYLDDCQIKRDSVADYAVDEGNAERLWKLSEELVGERFDL